MISKIRHGIDITTSKLNEIIEAINNLEGTGNSLNDLSSDYRTSLSEFNALRENYNTQLGDMLSNLPTLRELVASFASINEYGIEWEDKTYGEETEELSSIAALIENGNTAISKNKRIKIVVGYYNQIMPLGGVGVIEWRTPQILFDVTNGAIYADVIRLESNRKVKARVLFSVGNQDNDSIVNLITEIIESTPSISIVSSGISDAEGNLIYYWKVGNTIYDGGPTTDDDIDAGISHGPLVPVYKQGPAGKDGPEGPQGKDGKQGIPGVQGQPGKDGAAGANAVVDIMYSDSANGLNYSNVYNGQKYVGFRSYPANATASEIQATTVKWARLMGDMFIPFLDEDEKKIRWKKAESASQVQDLEIDLDGILIPGPKGDEGKPPLIRMVDSSTYSIINPVKDYIDGETWYTYYSDWFEGPEGKQGPPGADGLKGDQGEAGPPPTFRDIILNYEKDIIPNGKATSTGALGEYDLTFNLPRSRSIKTIQKISDDVNTNGLQDVYQIVYQYENGTTEDGTSFIVRHGIGVSYSYTDKDNDVYIVLTNGQLIKLFNLADVKGDKGEPSFMNIRGMMTLAEMNAYNSNNMREGGDGYCYVVKSEDEDGNPYYTLWMWQADSTVVGGSYYDTGANLAGQQGPQGKEGKRGSLWFFGSTKPSPVTEEIYKLNIITEGTTFAEANGTLIAGDLYVHVTSSNCQAYKATGYVDPDGNANFIKTDLDLGYVIDAVKAITVPYVKEDVEVNASITQDDSGKRTLNLSIPQGKPAYNITDVVSTLINNADKDHPDTTEVVLKLNDEDETELPAFYIPNGKAPKIAKFKKEGVDEYYAWTDAAGGYYYNEETGLPFCAIGQKGDKGEPGTDGNSITSVEIAYGESAYATADREPTTWQTNPFDITKGNYLWTRLTINFSKTSPKVYYSITRQPNDGTKGKDGDRGTGIYMVSTLPTSNDDNQYVTGDLLLQPDGTLTRIKVTNNIVQAEATQNLKGKDSTIFMFYGTDINQEYGKDTTLNSKIVPAGQSIAITPGVGSYYYNTTTNRLFVCVGVSGTQTTWKCILAPFSDFVTYSNGVLTIY